MKEKPPGWILLLLLLLVACSPAEESGSGTNPAAETATGAETIPRPAGWAEESHGSDVDPSYGVVFPQDKVNQITITIAPEDWAAMQANMTELFGAAGTEFGRRSQGDGPPGDFAPPAGRELPEDFCPPEGFEPPADGELPEGFNPGQGNPFGGGMAGPGFGGDFSSENPMWVAATVEFDGKTWTNVGVRYKGNSSLQSGWRSGDAKLPFKLDFDEFEDEHPEINDQRFYGFKQLSLANGFGDETYMRDTITYDLLEEAGLVAAETAYYEVTLDYGEGPVNLGLYTVVEVIDDTVVERYFDGDDGNIYEGDGPAASFAAGTREQIESSFQKENNEDEADYGDVAALYDVLHSEQRVADPAAWRARLESIFDVDTFLEWLALSSVVQHWDSYGSMSHNYYLYDDPATGRLTWISWDHNLVLGGSPGGAAPDAGVPNANRGRDFMGGRSAVSLDRAEVGDSWPLIRYLLDDPVYYAAYLTYLDDAAGLFNPDKMAARYQELAALIAPYTNAGDGGASFATAVQELTDLTYARYEETITFIASQ